MASVILAGEKMCEIDFVAIGQGPLVHLFYISFHGDDLNH